MTLNVYYKMPLKPYKYEGSKKLSCDSFESQEKFLDAATGGPYVVDSGPYLSACHSCSYFNSIKLEIRSLSPCKIRISSRVICRIFQPQSIHMIYPINFAYFYDVYKDLKIFF
jgi:hypothetical protein